MYVVTLPASRSDDAEAFAEEARIRGADLLEVRGDLTPEPRLADSALPILYAPRGAVSEWAAGRLFPWLDLEDREWAGDLRGERLIRSFHDHERTPSFGELEDRARDLWEQGADLVKIATRVQRPLDLLVLDNLRESTRATGPATVLGMGPGAALDRWRSPWTNELTYCFLAGHEASAEGQIPLEEYRRLEGEEPPRFFGILGGPGLRTLSPAIHHLLFARHGLRARYLVFETSELAETWRVLDRLGVDGFSVTAPFKREILDHLGRLEDLAARTASVNTCVRERGLWVGYQRDAVGLVRGYPFLSSVRRALIVGSGGVVPAVVEALRQSGVTSIDLLARDENGRRRLARELGLEDDELSRLPRRSADLVVWSVPVDLPELALPAAAPGARFLDLRYGSHRDPGPRGGGGLRDPRRPPDAPRAGARPVRALHRRDGDGRRPRRGPRVARRESVKISPLASTGGNGAGLRHASSPYLSIDTPRRPSSRDSVSRGLGPTRS
ncbi:MAG: type I 3-dehydroquinate dehydratase [Planctomycetota bacterium]